MAAKTPDTNPKTYPEPPLFFIDADGRTIPTGYDTSEHTSAQDDLGKLIPEPSQTDEALSAEAPSDGTEQITTLVDPSWELPWVPLSRHEHTLALRGLVNVVESRGKHGYFAASTTHKSAGQFINQASLMVIPLDKYVAGEQDIDIRDDREALEAIAVARVIQNAAAEDHWVRPGSKSFDVRVHKEIEKLKRADQDVVLEQALTVYRAQRMRSAFWHSQMTELEQTPAWKAAANDAQLQRRNAVR